MRHHDDEVLLEELTDVKLSPSHFDYHQSVLSEHCDRSEVKISQMKSLISNGLVKPFDNVTASPAKTQMPYLSLLRPDASIHAAQIEEEEKSNPSSETISAKLDFPERRLSRLSFVSAANTPKMPKQHF